MATTEQSNVEALRAKKFARTLKVLKKAVLEVQLLLLDGVDTDAQLHAAGALLAHSEYADVVTERSIAKLCGYTRCSNALTSENTRKGRYRISLSAKKVYDLQEASQFCCPACLIASKQFASNLSTERDPVQATVRVLETLELVRGSQYARSKSPRSKDPKGLKPSAALKNVKRGKASVQPGVATDLNSSSSSASSLSTRVLRSGTNSRGDVGTTSSSSNVFSTSTPSGDANQGDSAAASSSSPSFSSILLIPSKQGDVASMKNPRSSSAEALRSWKETTGTPPVSSLGQKKTEKARTGLTIQERVGDEKSLPILDYGGPSDAVEGYVPAKSHSRALPHVERGVKSKVAEAAEKSSDANEPPSTSLDQEIKNSVNDNEDREKAANASRDRDETGGRQPKGQQNGGKVFEEWAGLVSRDPVAKMCADIDNAFSIGHSTSSSLESGNTGIQDISAGLKPALRKQPGRKKHVRGVSWADLDKGPTVSKIEEAASTSASTTVKDIENASKAEEETKSVKQDVVKQDVEERHQTKLPVSLETARAARLASAEAIAAALTEAATAAAAGELNGSEAVARAGISILSATHNSSSAAAVSLSEVHEEPVDVPGDSEEVGLDEDELYARAVQAREDMRRPKMQRNDNANEDEDDDDDDVDDDDDDDDGEGFEGAREVGYEPPPKGFKAEVSMFGTIFMALEGWISAAAVAHIYGKDTQEEDNFLSVDGREYSRQAVIGDGVSAEILRTFSLCVSRALPEVVRALRISVPMSTLEQSMGRLVKTLSFVEALPPFGTKHWRMVVILLLDALSVQRLPWLGAHLLNNRAVFRKVLDSTGTSEAEYNVFRDLVLPMGRLPTFSPLSGG